jgi:hypothetical protein
LPHDTDWDEKDDIEVGMRVHYGPRAFGTALLLGTVGFLLARLVL